MKASFVVSPALKGSAGVESVHTDVLLLCTVAGTELGPTTRAVDESLNGLITRKIQGKKVGFTGEVGQMLSIAPKKAPAKRISIVGLGEVSTLQPRNLCKAIHMTVEDALKRGETRLAIPVASHSMSQIKLKGQAKIIREVVESLLVSADFRDLEGTFEVELLCTPHAARSIREGLAIAPNLDSVCCIDDEEGDD
jgi:hypothetical protein